MADGLNDGEQLSNAEIAEQFEQYNKDDFLTSETPYFVLASAVRAVQNELTKKRIVNVVREMANKAGCPKATFDSMLKAAMRDNSGNTDSRNTNSEIHYSGNQGFVNLEQFNLIDDRCRSAGVDEQFVNERIKAINPANSSIFNTGDDISSAYLFKEVFGQVIRFNATAKAWYVYDGIKWKPDPGSLMVEQYAKLLSRAMMIYSADFPGTDFQKYVIHLQEQRRRRTMIDDARSLLPVQQTDFDSDPYLFNCQNCVLNLKDHTVLKHSPDFLLSKVANVSFDPAADSKVFTDFMMQIMEGDETKVKYLQMLFGYAMTGTNEREECYMLYGSTTRNGKGTLTNTIRYVFGDYGANIQPETLAMQKNKDGRTASGDIARLNGCRFLQMSEPPKRMKIDVALLKTLIGRDVITARHLYEREFEFKPCFKLFINTNFLPVVLDDTLFSSGRVKVITFDRHFEESEQDKNLKDRLLMPETLSGILNWCFAGLRKYHANGNTIQTPEAIQKATEAYRVQSDKIRNFIDDCLIEQPFINIAAKDAYLAYAQWCHNNGFGVENKSNFFDELRSKGLLSDTGTVNGRTVYNVIKGYMLVKDLVFSDAEKPYDSG